MKYRAPQWLERLAERLVPPSSREHVLGDLAECSESTLQFLVSLAAVLPGIVWSQVRRRCGLGGLIFNAVLSAYVLGAVQAFFNPAFLDAGVWAWPRLAVVWAVWVAGAAMSGAYAPADKPAYRNFKGLIKTVISAVGAAVALRVPLTGVVVGVGAVIAISTALIVILGTPWLKIDKLLHPLSVETIPEHARIFQRGIWWRNARESAVAVILIGVQSVNILRSHGVSDRLESFLLIGGMLFVIYYLHFRANSRPVPNDVGVEAMLRFHCHEIARQRNILRAVPVWYLLPLVPGMIVSIFAEHQGISVLPPLGGVTAIFVFVWRLNIWGARWMDRQLQEANALQEKLNQA